MTIARAVTAALILGSATAAAVRAAESFETATAGPLAELATPVGTWTAAVGHAEIHAGHARDGRQSLRILGGQDHAVELSLPAPLTKPGRMSFWAERWTVRPPFAFVIEVAEPAGTWRQVHDAGGVRVGGFKTRVEAVVPQGTARLRLRATSHSGVMLDAIDVGEDRPMTIRDVTVSEPVMPVFVRRPTNPVIGVAIETAGGIEPLVIEGVVLSLAGTSRAADVAEIALLAGGESPTAAFTGRFGGAVGPFDTDPIEITGHLPLTPGTNWLWVSVRLEHTADMAGRIDAAVRSLRVSGRTVDVAAGDPPGSQRIGVAVRLRQEDGCDTYRIPGLTRTAAGTLLAAYDVRHRGPADLPADIDVGISRSTDGGRSWEPMRIALDMGRDPAFACDGVGDPCIFADRTTGRIHVAALWSHGRRAWRDSGPGIEPAETGQLVLASSDDDGRTWSEPVNITRAVKDPTWRLLLAGPGTGITLADGTLVFPAQFKDADAVPHSTLIWSRDHGEHWQVGSGVKGKTTESQLVQLGDGSIMINCRDDRGGARTVAVTTDLGATWRLHPTDRVALPESVCMASLLRLDLPGHGPRLFFSNPATTSGRHTMTVKVSADDGLTWPGRWHTLYDARAGFGYSCLAAADDAHLGVLYEGTGELLFLRLPFAELLHDARSP